MQKTVMSKNVGQDNIKTRLSKKLDGFKIVEAATSHLNPKIKKDSVEQMRIRSTKKLEFTSQLKTKSHESGFRVSPKISKKAESLDQLRVKIIESKTPKSESTSYSSMKSPPLIRQHSNTIKFNQNKGLTTPDSMDHIVANHVKEAPKTETYNQSYSERYIENKITELENVIKKCRDEINEMSKREVGEVDSDTTIVGSNFEVPKVEEEDILPPRDPNETLSQVRGMLKSIQDCSLGELTGMHDELHTIVEERNAKNVAEDLKAIISKTNT